ncbi:hypothetical protein MYSTI_01917 [Myxococcus stipitatus DSM 14675]|uniref:Tail protein n=1 Tax=Myxococcus stipitatus (strain DSM 14675 / JCM 12634 / Mx s8) TaxID=1278073 RepID=L7U528_MYXSD|nr:putative phage tail protein [Myxococcus stipitatus]AGC43248.1 hypothetical protein MYSTI_01917 [Myxococcus stipitatus DSM 14675]
MDAPSYARVIKKLLPPGSVWDLLTDGKLSALCLALAQELTRVDGRAGAVLNEADPRTATETLEDWERVLGLPDADVPVIPSTVAERRLAITQKLVRVGGQSKPYYVALAAACGYTVTIDDSYGATILRAGFRAGARVFGVQWAHVWRVDVQPPTGDALSHAELEAIIRRAAAAHTVVFFRYL